MNTAWSIMGVPRKTSTYTRTMARISLMTKRLTGGSFLAQGMVFKMPQTRPMMQPMAVATRARTMVFLMPLR